MDRHACSWVRANAVRVCTVPLRLDMAMCLMCGAVRRRAVYRGGDVVKVYTVAYEPHFTRVCVRYGVRHV